MGGMLGADRYRIVAHSCFTYASLSSVVATQACQVIRALTLGLASRQPLVVRDFASKHSPNTTVHEIDLTSAHIKTAAATMNKTL